MRMVLPSASPEEAAAIVAVIERFMRATAPPATAPPLRAGNGWQREALLEGIAREPAGDLADPWINT
jgi:hypothetical protein